MYQAMTATAGAPVTTFEVSANECCLVRAVQTPWLAEDDDLATVLHRHLPVLDPADTVIISEKVAVLLTGHTVPIDDFRPGTLARFLVRHVQPRLGSRGLSVPEKMEYVIRTIGAPRTVVAAVVGGLTRLVGRRGDFYRIAGPVARDVDGGRPPYEDVLFPPLPVAEATRLCEDLAREVGANVAIVDINDYGGSIRARSHKAQSAAHLMSALRANPLGQRASSTPIGVVRCRHRTLRVWPP